MRRDRIDYLAAGNAGRNLFGVFKTRQVLLPIFRQLAVHHGAPHLAEILMLLFILIDQFVPFLLVLLAAFERFSEMGQRFVGHIEELIFGPAQMPLGFAHRIFARRVAVRLARARSRHAVTDRGLHRD